MLYLLFTSTLLVINRKRSNPCTLTFPRQFLKDYSGVCVTDGYQVYHTVEKELEDLKIAGCWVHCRRKFDEALKAVPKAAQKESLSYLVIKQIQAVYREEDKLKELKPEDRLKQRQVVIKPLVDALFVYLKSNERKASTAKLKQAVTYALNQEKYLRVFLEDGEVPMDNNASERAIRGFCIGKKNWEMIDTINGATSSAIIYSIAETAKANNLKPYEVFLKSRYMGWSVYLLYNAAMGRIRKIGSAHL